MTRRGVVSIFFSTVVFFAAAHTAFAGFGITPPYVRNDVLKPGSEFTQEIIIVRSDPVEDLNADISINVPGIEQWFSIDKGLEFVLPKGEKQVRMNVTVRVPEAATLGPRKGNIRIRTYGNELPTSGVSLALGAQIDVSINVVEQIFDFAVRRVELPDAEEGREKWWMFFPGKIRLLSQIENTGNVPAAPVRVTFDIYDTSGNTLLEHTESTNKPDTVLPFNTKKIESIAPTRLLPGAYRVKYQIYKNVDLVAQTGELALSILPKGTIPGYEPYGFMGLSTGDKLSVAVPGTLLLIIVLWFVFGRRGGTRKRRTPKARPPREDDYEDDPPAQDVQPRRRPVSVSTGVVDLSRRR